ncbi:TasA family protein [Desulfosporosinus sp. BG]|uniref:TasA family protein n=1 Tax=Desulfosporosinus sp. BG TaxID=1633135 RepID=UPI00083A5954|nr:TasA family protein [Desulfosporosinus sp. BG]ODA41470.1 hypothetical protein DSBG_1746 [Desulfosporosinus sp. BG]
MNKKLLMLIPTGVIAVSLLVGGSTYALFRSSATNTNNNFTAGTINLTQNRDQGDTIPGPMFYTNTSDPTGSFPYDTDKNIGYQPPGGESFGGLAPGDSMTRAMNLFNNGPNALDAKVTKLKATVNPRGLTSGRVYDQFTDKLNVLVQVPSVDKILYDGPLSGLLNGSDSGWTDISPALRMNKNGGPMNITFKVTLDPTANNDIQNQTFVFDFSFYAEQLRNNP